MRRKEIVSASIPPLPNAIGPRRADGAVKKSSRRSDGVTDCALFTDNLAPGWIRSVTRASVAMEAAEILCRLFLLAASAHWIHGLEDGEPTDNAEENFTTETSAAATRALNFRHPRWYKRGSYDADEDDADTPDNAEENFTTETNAVATTALSFRNPRWYKRGGHEADEDDEDEHMADQEMDDDNVEENKALTKGKSDPWSGYYDFLINEGSYKFWAVFQIATAALLIYSGFAAVYYAKVNPPASPDYGDYFIQRRRKRRSGDDFLGLGPTTFQRIVDAVSGESQRHRASG